MNATFAPRFRLGNYELLLELASGGMATVGIALQHGAAGFERLVVVKRVHRHLLKNKEFSNMFRDEARLSSSVRHANVVPVIDVIENEGELCLVMEYFESLALSTMLEAAKEAHKSVAPAVASRILSDTLAGLHAAHEAVDIRRAKLGIVHRDVSPQNVIVDIGGVSRVIDFGVAKAASRLTQTRSGYVKGKFGYMSPEQVEALPIDRRADVFAAGVVLHEVLTGRRLFDGENEFETMRRVLKGEIVDPSASAAHLWPEVDRLVRKALARAPEERFQTALDFQTELERVIPPAAPQEVAACLVDLCGPLLDQRHAALLEMLGDELEKLSPRSSGKSLGGGPSPLAPPGAVTIKGFGLKASLVQPAVAPGAADAPATSQAPADPPALDLNNRTLKSADGVAEAPGFDVPAHEVLGVPPRMGTVKVIVLSAFGSAVVAAIAFAAMRTPASPPVGPTASPPPAAHTLTTASAGPSATIVRDAPPVDASAPPAATPTAPPLPAVTARPKPRRDTLQPSPY